MRMAWFAASCTIMLIVVIAASGCDGVGREATIGSMHACFAPHEDCRSAFVSLVSNATDVSCAFYDLEDELLMRALERVGASVVMDDGAVEDVPGNLVVASDSDRALMHNKFCVLDGKVVVTGSLNPTSRGFGRNDNNLLLIHSPLLARAYQKEYEELASGMFGGGSRKVSEDIAVDGGSVEVFFCPEDGCRLHLMDVLFTAEERIRFMTFSFTDTDVADLLVQMADEGVDVSGVMEGQRINNPYSVFTRLNGSAVDVVADANPGVMHHKVFIIDDDVVVTGSYNPTLSGNERNDENMLIICCEEVAHDFIQVFDQVRGSNHEV